jgi:hypothetical protein
MIMWQYQDEILSYSPAFILIKVKVILTFQNPILRHVQIHTLEQFEVISTNTPTSTE